jgi:signal transduction histidine kinase
MSLMSHELRTPLNGIIQLSDALCRGAGAPGGPRDSHVQAGLRTAACPWLQCGIVACTAALLGVVQLGGKALGCTHMGPLWLHPQPPPAPDSHALCAHPPPPPHPTLPCAGGEMNPKGSQFVRTIKNSSNHLLNIINDILDVAALKEGGWGMGVGGVEICPGPRAGALAVWCCSSDWPWPVLASNQAACNPPACGASTRVHECQQEPHPPSLRAGKLTVKHEVVSLAKAVEHVVEIVSPLAKKEVSIIRKIDPRTPLVIGDFSRMVQASAWGEGGCRPCCEVQIKCRSHLAASIPRSPLPG